MGVFSCVRFFLLCSVLSPVMVLSNLPYLLLSFYKLHKPFLCAVENTILHSVSIHLVRGNYTHPLEVGMVQIVMLSVPSQNLTQPKLLFSQYHEICDLRFFPLIL